MCTSHIAFDASSINHHPQQSIVGSHGCSFAAVPVPRYCLERRVEPLGAHGSENLRDLSPGHQVVEENLRDSDDDLDHNGIMVTPLGDYLAPPLIGRFFGS